MSLDERLELRAGNTMAVCLVSSSTPHRTIKENGQAFNGTVPAQEIWPSINEANTLIPHTSLGVP